MIKKKWPIRMLLTLLCMAMLCSVPAYAMETRASERINTASVTLAQKSNGAFNIGFSVRATGKMDIIGASSVEIQRNTIFGWFTGKEYRAVVMIYVKNATGTSTQQLTS